MAGKPYALEAGQDIASQRKQCNPVAATCQALQPIFSLRKLLDLQKKKAGMA